ncbi:MAG: 2-hydroxyglutaryl-CoA dehydratase [SAR324 cluster bacterium]|nr:2-hydroxyglutaryl-CoA dehydratase [SAR324 cluster bacterium]
MITVGIDIGSITAKSALYIDGKIRHTKVIFTGYHSEAAGQTVLEDLLKESGVAREAVDRIVATGYGRKNVKLADKSITEITCHGAGAHYLNPMVRTIIDIGGQDSKAIFLDESGKVKDFMMNDKCAAGTGRFLEVMARALEVDLNDFGEMALRSAKPAKISSLCAVFAESEVISLISKGEPRENIMAGIHESIAVRVAAMAKRMGIVEPVMMTGGVAKNMGVVKALEEALQTKLIVLQTAQENGAIGAAILASNLVGGSAS